LGRRNRNEVELAGPEETFPARMWCANPEIGMANFSFNKPAGACRPAPAWHAHQANLGRLVNEELRRRRAITGWDANYVRLRPHLQNAGQHYGFTFDLDLPVKELTAPQRDLLFYGVESPQFRRHFPDIKPPVNVSQGRFEGIVNSLLRRYAEHIHDPTYREKIDVLMVTQLCPDCQGTRLRPENRAVTVDGRGIVELSRLSLSELDAWLKSLPARLDAGELLVARPILNDLDERIDRLLEVGVGYLTMERPSPSLSAGEAQRLRMAALLGSGLTGVLYVLDEPTIGLHQRDTLRLIRFLRRLRDLGNTVLVIEHDLELIRQADYVVDIGPGAGKAGGQVVVPPARRSK
jgi:excinuclease ABC subunit A